MIVDASAVIEIIKGQPDAERCSRALLNAASSRMSAANLLEAYLVADRSDDTEARARLDRVLQSGRVRIEPVTEIHARLARAAHDRYGRGRHPAKLNFGD